MANYFSINNISIVSPTGSIMAFLGTSDPEGWVIMNGVPRVNSGQYNNLISMGIGTVDVNNNDYIPPNYNGAFLRGVGTSPINPLYIGETNAGQYQDMGVMNHSHTLSDPGHAHGVSDPTHAHGVYDPTHAHGVADPGHAHGFSTTPGTDDFNFSDQNSVADADRNNNRQTQNTYGAGTGIGIYAAATGIGIYAAATGIGINTAFTGISISTATVSAPYSATETRPFNYGVNWILKL